MNKIIQGNNIDILKTLEDNSVDSIVTDPPYGIEFLGKDWDKDTGAMETWLECLRVLKPGGHLLAFGAPRTYHQLATNVELAGFEIRDQLQWLYGSGFPKAQDIGKAIQKRVGVEETKFNPNLRDYKGGDDYYSGGFSKQNPDKGDVVCTDDTAKQWEGWKTMLKPAHEPIVMARKPFKGSCVNNVLENGTGALNIDASRVPLVENEPDARVGGCKPEKKKFVLTTNSKSAGKSQSMAGALGAMETHQAPGQELGRFPSNVIGDFGDEPYAKFFYCPKVNKKERNVGCEGLEEQRAFHDGREIINDTAYQRGHKVASNTHPTVKPVALMAYLVRLVTPPGGLVVDPFCGSGSTGMACKELGFDFIGMDLDERYCEISRRRIGAWDE